MVCTLVCRKVLLKIPCCFCFYSLLPKRCYFCSIAISLIATLPLFGCGSVTRVVGAARNLPALLLSLSLKSLSYSQLKFRWVFVGKKVCSVVSRTPSLWLIISAISLISCLDKFIKNCFCFGYLMISTN